MAQISVNNLTFSYGGESNVFDNVSLILDTSWKCGLVGRNGIGKTTFLKLLNKELKYEGTIINNNSMLYFPFHISNDHHNTLDIVYEILGDIEEWRLYKELDLLKVNENVLYRPFNTLSYGEQIKVMLAMLFIKDVDYLLIDEPTNHLDYAGRILVSNYLKKKSGFLLVSHDREFLDNCIDHIIVLNKTSIEVRSGSFSAWYKDKLDKDNLEINKNIQLRKEVKRLELSFRHSKAQSDRIEKTKYGHKVFKSSAGVDRGFIGHKAAKKMKTAKNIEKRKLKDIEERKTLLKDVEEVDDLKLFNEQFHQRSIIQIINATIGYNKHIVLENFNLHIEDQDIIQIEGKNGSGKSSIIKVLLDELEILSGTIFKGSNLKISYVPQSARNLSGNLFDLADERDVDVSQFMSILAKMGVDRKHFDMDLEDFSEGSKKKVLLALSLCESAHLYVWDEPLNYIDIFTRMQIEKLIELYKPTILFVEHDNQFSDAIKTKTIKL